MADICINRLTVTGPAEERRRLVQLWADGKPVFNRILPVPRRFKDDNEWRCLNWGTKSDVGEEEWDCASVEEQEEVVTIWFATAWTPPLPVIEAMSVLYSGLEFDLAYFESGERFAGEAHFVEGEGQTDLYEGDDPAYQDIAFEFGWEEDDEGDDEE